MPTLFSGLIRLHGEDIAILQRLIDPLAITLLFIAFNASSLAAPPEGGLPPWCWVGLCVVVLLRRARIYSSYRSLSLFTLARRVTSSWLLVLTALLLISFATKTTATFSRLDTSLWALASWLFLLANHVGLRQLLRLHRSRGGNSRTILYWGLPRAAAAFAAEVEANRWMGLKLVAWFGPEPPAAGLCRHGLPAFGGHHSEMRRWLESHAVDRIVFSHVTRDGLEMADLLRIFGDTSVPVVYAPAWASPSMHFTVDQVGNQSCIDLWGSRQRFFDRQLKRSFDLLLTGAGVLLISPLLLLIALAVRLSSPGPILFRQQRYGLDGKPFAVYKFRSMRVLEAGDQPGLKQATRDDPRVTPVGAVLRRWSLDELPQLFNVLKGEMSLVGPRPHAIEHNEYYRKHVAGYMQRHAFKPGITGLAQVEGWRGETAEMEAMARRIDADLRYQRNWSLKLDIKILIKTLLHLRSPNAY
ncbi:undecaprenyl-phosphate glucose phosphotransferase [bacterium]|nr:undecaprenyl-phosphate glucose phosphotransferase [bacterium]